MPWFARAAHCDPVACAGAGRAAHCSAMRTLSLACLFLLALSTTSRADDSSSQEPRKWRAGLLLGINMSGAFGTECVVDCDIDLSGFGDTDFSPEGSFRTSDHLSFAGFFSYEVRPRWSVRLEARFTTKGAKVQHTAPALRFEDVGGMDVPRFVALPYTLEHRLHYLQVPVLAQMDIPYDDRFRPHVLAGVGIGYLISSSSSGEGSIVDAETFDNLGTVMGEGDQQDAAKGLDLSVIVGAGMVFPLGRGGLELGVRYELGVLSSLDGTFTNQLTSSRTIYQPFASEPTEDLELTEAPFAAVGTRHSIVSVIAGYHF